MKLETGKRNGPVRSKDVLDQPNNRDVVLFEPHEVLKEGDFERMVVGKEHTNLAMDLAVASMFFPERISDQKADLEKMTQALRKGYASAGVAKKIGSAWMSFGLLKPWLPAEVVDQWAKKEFKSLVTDSHLGTSLADQCRMALGLKMLFPEIGQEHPFIQSIKNNFKQLVGHLTIHENNPITDDLEILAYGFLLFPELRSTFPVPPKVFDTIKIGMNHARIHTDPFNFDDLDSFPKVMFLSAILGHSGAHISADGRIQLHARSSHKKSPPLPDRFSA